MKEGPVAAKINERLWAHVYFWYCTAEPGYLYKERGYMGEYCLIRK